MSKNIEINGDEYLLNKTQLEEFTQLEPKQTYGMKVTLSGNVNILINKGCSSSDELIIVYDSIEFSFKRNSSRDVTVGTTKYYEYQYDDGELIGVLYLNTDTAGTYSSGTIYNYVDSTMSAKKTMDFTVKKKDADGYTEQELKFSSSSLKISTDLKIKSIDQVTSGTISLTSINVLNGTQTISAGAFQGCTALTSYTLPSTITTIGVSAFYDCASLETIKIPDGVSVVDEYSFAECTSATSIYIGSGVTKITSTAFSGDKNVNYIEYNGTVAQFNKITLEDGWHDDLKAIKVICTDGEVQFVVFRIKLSASGSGSFVINSSDSETKETISFSSGNEQYVNCKNEIKSIDSTSTSSSTATNLTAIEIPSSVTSIGAYAFYNCTKLASVTMSNSCTTFGYQCFRGCSSLTSFTIPSGTTTIPANMFYGCSSLTSVSIPNGVTSIGNYAFYKTKSPITIPSSVTSIGSYAFGYNTALESISIPCSVGSTAFEHCSSLETVTFGSSVTSVSSNCFSYCTSLKNVTLPSVTSISSNAFGNCSSLESISIPNLTSIGSSAFSGCTSLSSITFDKLVSIGESSFNNCTSLTEIDLPSTVTSFGATSFNNCSSLNKITLRAKSLPTLTGSTLGSGLDALKGIYVPAVSLYTYKEDSSWSTYESILKPIVAQNEIRYMTSDSSVLVLPDSYTSTQPTTNVYSDGIGVMTFDSDLTSIGDYMFSDNTLVTRVFFPDGITKIGKNIFVNCSSLLSFYIPEGVTSIGTYFCYKCYSITEIVLPESLTYISSSGIRECTGLKKLKISSNTYGGGSYAVAGNTALETFDGVENMYWFNALTIGNNGTAFEFSLKNPITYLYNYGLQSSNVTSCVLSVTQINYASFQYCRKLTSVTLSPQTKSISGSAFSNCSSLKSIELPSTITSISAYSFEKCTSLTSVTLPTSLTSITEGLFSNCTALKTITLPNSITTIGKYAFAWDTSLTSINMPTSLTTISGYAFHKCSGITSDIVIPSGVTSIDISAFYGTTSISSLTLNEGLETIGDQAFFNYQFSELTIPSTVTSIGIQAFDGNKLQTVTCLATTPPTLRCGTNDGCPPFSETYVQKVLVPSASVDAYKADTYWSKYASKIQAIS